LELKPAGRVTGRLIDDSGAALAGVLIHNGSKNFRAQGDIKSELLTFPYIKDSKPLLTDQNGRFAIGGLMPGKKYAASAAQRFMQNNRTIGQIFSDLVVESGETKDLGDVVVDRK